ncbi:PIR Superfamily Protein [Plasmodium ovale curtisi]|uniref:PIR Superfamily Protein n=1 Tax=Plasmodium ovale curtisi TaxID=864141 RepID=A0A1A8X2U2_PLAOA|nr:PIR Superfamily Protein [Plasmodium ovale curtisi]SBS99557.1 PIR Superfamily Protein [Plasmodium ovale curtisi]
MATTSSDNFTYDQLKDVYNFIKTINFGKMYEEFNDKNEYEERGKTYCNQIKGELLSTAIDDEILFNLCNILYKIIVKINEINNDIFNGIHKNDKMYCFCLKYWLYDHLDETNMPKGKINIDETFQKWQNAIKEKINKELSDPCIFRELNWENREKLKSIYAFILLYYKNINFIHEKGMVNCKYLNFFGKGLKAYYDSLRECSTERKEDNYCKEFNEFQEIYKLDKLYWKNSTLNTEYNYSAESNDNCPLVIESLQSPLIISYKDKKNILYLSNEPNDFQKSTIISTSSAIGTTVGISAFLLYLYKYTSLGSLFGTQMQKNNINFDNMAEETNDFTIPTSKLEHTHFENTNYKISYSTLKNS